MVSSAYVSMFLSYPTCTEFTPFLAESREAHHHVHSDEGDEQRVREHEME
jgi:hypothetical protein